MKKILASLLAVAMLFALSIPAMADHDDFVPSIELKPGPGIVENPADSGNGGVILMPDGTEVIVPVSEIIVTPIAEADGAADHIKDALKDAFGDVSGVGSLTDLVANLQDILGDGIAAEDVVIKDLFHVDVTGEYKDYIDNGGKLIITFDVSSNIAVALSKINGAWSTISGDALTLNADGTITLTIGNIGVYAFLKNVASVDVDPENPGVSSPTTGDNTLAVVGSALALLAVSAVLFVMYKKQEA